MKEGKELAPWETLRGGNMVETALLAPQRSSEIVKHSCHFVLLEVGLLAQVER